MYPYLLIFGQKRVDAVVSAFEVLQSIGHSHEPLFSDPLIRAVSQMPHGLRQVRACVPVAFRLVIAFADQQVLLSDLLVRLTLHLREQ